eukprot:8159174-Pyramimonas_sp.AAC.1
MHSMQVTVLFPSRRLLGKQVVSTVLPVRCLSAVGTRVRASPLSRLALLGHVRASFGPSSCSRSIRSCVYRRRTDLKQTWLSFGTKCGLGKLFGAFWRIETRGEW